MEHAETTAMPIRRTNRYTVVKLPEEIDIANADSVRRALLKLINTDGPATRPLVIDMTDTGFCDSCGVNAVLRAHTRADAMGRRIHLVIPPGGITRKVFDITAVSRLIPVYDDVGSAIAAAVVTGLDEH
jgi:anti-anti-sigma factor